MSRYIMQRSDARIISDYISLFGPTATLEEVFDHCKRGRQYVCPKCEGRGYIMTKVQRICGDIYEPDEFVDKKCDMCDGIGYTEEKYVPRMVQDGWELAK